jgi:hypothetical protein
MFAISKQTLPVRFLTFGVNDQGVIVPILRHDKACVQRRGVVVRALPLERKPAVRAG